MGHMVALLLIALSTAASQAQAVELTSQSARAQAYYHFSLSQFLRFEGEDERAVQEIRKALDYDPESSSLHFSLAQSLADTARLEEAVEACERAIELDSENPNPHFLLGLIYRNFFQRGRSEMLAQAIKALARGVELEPDRIEALSHLGQLYLIGQRWEDAARIYGQLRSLRPDLPRNDLLHAQALANMERTDEAIDVIQTPSEDSALELDRLVLLAQLYTTAKRFNQAIDTYEQALELAPEGQHRWDLKFVLGRLLIQQARFPEAESVLEEIVNSGSTDPQARVELGKAQEGSRHYSKAVASFQKVLAQEPDNMEANYYLASSLRNLGRRDEAVERMNHLLSLTESNPDATAPEIRARFRQFLGVLYQETGRHEESVRLFQRLCADQPEDLQAKLGLVYALKRAGRLDDARLLSSELLEKEPEKLDILVTHARILASAGELDAAAALLYRELRKKQDALSQDEEIEDYYLSVGQLYHEHRSYKKARRILKEGLDHHPDSQSLTFHLGSVFERLNDIDAAERQFQRVLAADPQHAAALNYLGYMLADHELRLDEALGYIERALDQDPHNGAYLDSLGWAYFKLNKLELAEKSLVLAIQINEGDPTILEHLGDLYVRKGDRSSALDCYRKSVAAAEDPGELRKVQGKLTALEKEFRRAGRHREPNR